jgi:maltose-binding protein MalE
VLKALFKDADVKKVINLDVVFQAAANCYYRPAVPEYTQCADALSVELQNAMVNNKDARKALQDAAAKLNKLSGW